jgi:hypothetical protein
VVNYSGILILLLIISILQIKYFSSHFNSTGSFVKSSPKRNLLIATILFSMGILYRAIFNSIKLMYRVKDNNTEDESKAPNPVDFLER